jgi:hypothetical protein
MRVLAARFADRRIASAVKEMLERRLRLHASAVGIAPLGDPDRPSDTDTLLAGRFPDDEAPNVIGWLSEAGGEIVVDVDEAWTKPRPQRSRPSWKTTFERGRVHA